MTTNKFYQLLAIFEKAILEKKRTNERINDK